MYNKAIAKIWMTDLNGEKKKTEKELKENTGRYLPHQSGKTFSS